MVLNKNKLEEKILSLYRAGHSQKDISIKLKITPLTIRKILQDNGYETHNFRALNENVTNVILLLVRNGVLFSDIENICQISFHAIRDVVARHNLQYESKRVRNKQPPVLADGFEQNRKFVKKYLSGASFCSLCEEFEFTDEDILNMFLSLDESQILTHKESLRKKVLKDAKKKLSTTAIARKHCISMAIVRNILRQEISETAPKPSEPEAVNAAPDEKEGAAESCEARADDSAAVDPSESEAEDPALTDSEKSI